MWVHEPAGYGKTAVAQTTSNDMQAQHQNSEFEPLGGTFFFWRTSLECNNPSRFVITLACQFALSIPWLLPHVEKAVKRNPMIVNKALEVQLVKLIIEPFNAVGHVDQMPNRLVIIDGLDECINFSDRTNGVNSIHAGDKERSQLRVLDLAHTLLSHNLPLSFLIFSRPEAWIKHHMESDRFKSITETVDLYKMGGHLQDVELYLRAELDRISLSIPGQDMEQGGEKWPGKRQVQRLLWQTGGHMLYAATAIRHIDNPYDDPRRRLQDILDSPCAQANLVSHSGPFATLHDLYRQIMLSCPESNRLLMLEVLEETLTFVDPTERHETKTLPSALRILDRLSGRAPGESLRALRCLHGVLRHDGGGQNNFFVHSSFPEFLVNSSAALTFTVNLRDARRRLSSKCFQCMTSVSISGPEVLEGHLEHALKTWPYYWYCWDPLDEGEYATQLNMLRTIDLGACLVRANMTPYQNYVFARRLYDCRILTAILPMPAVSSGDAQHRRSSDAREVPANRTAPLPASQCTSYVHSSVERAFTYMLHPLRVQSFAHSVPFMVFYYFWSCWSQGDKWDVKTDPVVKAWVSLKQEHPHLYQPLSLRLLFETWPEFEQFLAWVKGISLAERNRS